MEDLRCVTLHFYFKVLDAELFGGKGTKGYAATSANECLGSEEVSFDKMVSLKEFNKICDKYRKCISVQMKVPEENVVAISRDEYKENTDEDEE